MATIRRHDPDAVPAAVGGYSQGVEVEGGRLLFRSGQIPEDTGGEVPAGFEAQCELAWRIGGLALRRYGGGGPRRGHHVSDAPGPDREANSRVLRDVLWDARPALTVVVVQTLRSRWLLEIEAVAAA